MHLLIIGGPGVKADDSLLKEAFIGFYDDSRGEARSKK